MKMKNKKGNVSPLKPNNDGGKQDGKMSKAREALREEMRAILAAARERNLIQKTTTVVRKARTFTTEDILSFISDVKVKTKEEVKKVLPKRDTASLNESKHTNCNSPVEEKKESIESHVKTTSYYDRWYDLVSPKEQN